VLCTYICASRSNGEQKCSDCRCFGRELNRKLSRQSFHTKWSLNGAISVRGIRISEMRRRLTECFVPQISLQITVIIKGWNVQEEIKKLFGHRRWHQQFYVYGSVHRWSILIIDQRDATERNLFIILEVHSTCFGCQPHTHTLSGVHKTVTTASGTAHIFVQLPPSNVAKVDHFGGR